MTGVRQYEWISYLLGPLLLVSFNFERLKQTITFV